MADFDSHNGMPRESLAGSLSSQESDVLTGLSETDALQADPHAACLLQAARTRGIEACFVKARRKADKPLRSWLNLKLTKTEFLYRMGVLLHYLPDGSLVHINGLASQITTRKSLTKSFLQTVGVSSPSGFCWQRDEIALAEAWFGSWQQPVCLKPEQGKKGTLVFPYIDRLSHFRTVFDIIGQYYPEIIVEESFPGQVYRYFYVHPHAVAVKLSRPASVKGNGVSSLESLIAAKNQIRLERQVPGHKLIKVDAHLYAYLGRQGKDLNYVPPAGERCYLQAVSNGATGADSIACAPHESYAQRIEKACQSIPGLRIAAIDTMLRRPHEAANPTNYRVLEINSSPGVLPYHYPWEGPPQDVSGAILDLLTQLDQQADHQSAAGC